jgi:protoporphyrinogen oxidase
MKIAVIGAGFTGLTASLRLLQSGHSVTVFEKESAVGGLAGTYRKNNWNWPIEQHYHHWFTNDASAINLIKELGLEPDFFSAQTRTSIYWENRFYDLNSPLDVLSFSPLSIFSRIKFGAATLFLKLLRENDGLHLERYTATDWLKRFYGPDGYRIVWEPLLKGKFGPFSEKVNMTWFWARVKKRTMRLGYLKGGYGRLLDQLANRIHTKRGIIRLQTPFESRFQSSFDKIIATIPSPIFLNLFPKIPAAYKRQLTSIPHLHALNLLIMSKEKILPDIYWLNINDRTFPFIALIQQTNLTDAQNYGNSHLAYVGNYLPTNHPYLRMSKKELYRTYLPYLKKINPQFDFDRNIISLELFSAPFAQPVFSKNYSKIRPGFRTPVPNVYLANMDMVYPWDRGTNYAIEMGEKVAELAVRG